jgi:hypothetical protein
MSETNDARLAFTRTLKAVGEFFAFPYLDLSGPLITLSGMVLQFLFVVVTLRQLLGGTQAFQAAPLAAQTAWLLILLGSALYLLVYQCYRIPSWRSALDKLTPRS